MREYVFELKIERGFQRIAVELGINRSSKLLNLACEYQRVPPALASILDPDLVYGIEINRDIVAKEPRIKYADVDADAFPFSSRSFDSVVSLWGMEHFQSGHVFQEAARVLKPGGFFIFLTPNMAHPIFWISKHFGESLAGFYYQKILRSPYHPHQAYYHFNSAAAIERASQAAGLTVERLAYVGPGSITGYFTFSKCVTNLVIAADRCLTNRWLYRFKPYLIAALKQEK